MKKALLSYPTSPGLRRAGGRGSFDYAQDRFVKTLIERDYNKAGLDYQYYNVHSLFEK
jgi:hypothetical protein